MVPARSGVRERDVRRCGRRVSAVRRKQRMSGQLPAEFLPRSPRMPPVDRAGHRADQRDGARRGRRRRQGLQQGRNLAAWLGLVPRQATTGGKPRLLGISERGNRYLRKNCPGGVCRPAETRRARHPDGALASRPARASARERRRRSPGEQAGAHLLGGASRRPRASSRRQSRCAEHSGIDAPSLVHEVCGRHEQIAHSRTARRKPESCQR